MRALLPPASVPSDALRNYPDDLAVSRAHRRTTEGENSRSLEHTVGAAVNHGTRLCSIATSSKKGSLFYALSYNTRIDQDNVAAVLPTVVDSACTDRSGEEVKNYIYGKLIISVNKDTYEELGLQGKPSLYSGKHAMRYIITIDLTDSAMSPDGKKFQRVRWALTEKKPLSFDFLVAWDNSEEPPTISYFSNYVVEECPYKTSSSVSRDQAFPVLKSEDLHGEEGKSCCAHEFFDWLGAISNNIDCNHESSSFISSFCCPEPNTLVGQAHLCTITGFITPVKIQQLVNQLRYTIHVTGTCRLHREERERRH
ncbi:unnamed protein product, partial [Ranitomeya imitator]